MANGVEHLSSLKELLPGLKLAIVNETAEEMCAVWISGRSFGVSEAVSIGNDMYLCAWFNAPDYHFFSVRTDHPMGAFAGDTINIDDGIAEQIADNVHSIIEAGALLNDT